VRKYAKKMEKNIFEAIRYFSVFDYPPTADEIYCFLKNKASFGQFKGILEKMVGKGVLTVIFNYQFSVFNEFSIPNFQNKKSKNRPQNTVGGYGIQRYKISKIKYKNYLIRQTNSIKKLSGERFKTYIKLLRFFPQIKLVGLSGSISMLNAKDEDDIDLFIITSENRLFTGRLIALILAQLLGLRRIRSTKAQNTVSRPPHPKGAQAIDSKQVSSLLSRNKICLNLFFDESRLNVPKFKKTEFVAHEILQMKPIINKFQTYEKFLQANSWVKKIFPNAESVSSIQYPVFSIQIKRNRNNKQKVLFPELNTVYRIPNAFANLIEKMLERAQLTLINRHKTKEIITSQQLWFHPEDFGKKINL